MQFNNTICVVWNINPKERKTRIKNGFPLCDAHVKILFPLKKRKKYMKIITKNANTEFDTLIFNALELFLVYLSVQIHFS